MANFDVNTLLKQLQGGGVETLSKTTGADANKVNTVLKDALPVLVGKMSDNASTAEGAASLSKALNEHKTGDVIDAAAFLKGADSKDGEKILSHILGSDKDAATKALSKKSGLSSSKVSTILSLVAPLLLSQIGNNNTSSSGSGLGSLLGGMLGGGSSSSSGGGIGASLLGSLLGGGTSSSSSSSGSGLGGLLGGLLGGKEEEEEKEESSSVLGGLGSLAMNLFGDSDALKTEESKKKTGKKTGTSSSGKKTSSKKPASAAKKTASKKTTSTAKKTASKKTTSTTKKTATKKTSKK